MKRLHFILLTAFLLFSQWGSIDHVHTKHVAGEVCDFCIQAKSFDHAVSSSFQSILVSKQTQQAETLLVASTSQSVTRHYAARAPPRFL